MNCPNCGTPNEATSRFCGSCGAPMPVQAMPPVPPAPPAPRPVVNPISMPASLTGIAALLSGALVIIGWLMPWFGLGAGYGSSSGVGAILGSTGIVSGLQLSLITLVSGLAALGLGGNSGLGVVIGLIALASFGILITFPILGILQIRNGNSAYGIRLSTSETDRQTLHDLKHQIRSRSISGLILLVVVYALTSLIPFMTNALGGGFYVTIGAFALSFLAVFLSQ